MKDRHLTRWFLSTILVMGVLFAAPQTRAAGGLLFDSWDGTELSSSRAAGSSPGCRLTVDADTAIGAIGVRNIGGDMNLKYVIFDIDQSAPLYVSAPKAFTVNDDPWKVSDDFSFTLLAGKTYAIGAIADASAFWTFDFANASSNGITSSNAVPNFSNYASPTRVANGFGDAAVRLYDGAAVIPEPSAMLLAGLGAVATALLLRRHR